MNKNRLFSNDLTSTAAALLVSLVIMAARDVQAGCGVAPIYSKSVSACTNKCGWNPCVDDNPPIVKYFLKDTYTQSISISEFAYNGLASSSCVFNQKEKNEMSRGPDCSVINNWSGSISYSDGTYSGSGSIIGPDETWDSGGQDLIATLEGSCLGCLFPSIVHTPVCTPTTKDSSKDFEHDQSGPTWEGGCWSGDDNTYICNTLQVLSKEYTDAMLRSGIISLLPPYPSDWGRGGGSAFYSLNASHSNGCGGKMKYRFFMCGQNSSQKGQQFKLEWKEITTFPDGSPSKTTRMSEVLTGDGNPDGMYSSEHEVGVPDVPCSIQESGDAKITPIPGGGGGPGGGGPHGH